MTAWMDFVERGNSGYLRTRDLGHSYNDWLAPGSDDTPPELLATAYWAHDAALMAELADVTGRRERGRGVPGAAGEDRLGLRRRVRPRRRAARLGHPDRLRPRPAHGTRARPPARGRRRPPGRGDRRGGLAPDHRVRRRRLPASGAQLGRPHRRRLPCPRAADVPLLAVHDRPGRDDDLGTLGRLVGGARLPVRLDELVQPLLARLGRRVALPVRPRHRPGAGDGGLPPPAAAPAPLRAARPR